jgi:putative membrane protein
MSSIVGFIIYLVVSAFIIWVVGKLNLGLSISGFGSAIIAAVVIALVTTIVNWISSALGLTFGGDVLGTIITLIIAAVVLMISDIFVPCMSVKGFSGALIAAIAISIVSWFVNWVLSLFIGGIY